RETGEISRPSYIWLQYIPKQKRRKLDAKAREGLFMGYGNNGFKIYCLDNEKLEISRDVRFVEESATSENPEETVIQISEDFITDSVIDPKEDEVERQWEQTI